MTLRQFYTDRHNLTEGSSVKLPESEAEHIRKSLRMQSGDQILLFDGQRKYSAEITLVSKESVLCKVTKVWDTDRIEGPQVTLMQSLIRAHNFELIIQKATELGVANIIPVQTEFSQVKLERIEQKLERWDKISLEACKQSERTQLVNIYNPIEFNQIRELDLLSEFDLVIMCTVPRLATSKINQITQLSKLIPEIKSANQIAVIIGPEGGFSPTEIKNSAEWSKVKFAKLTDGVLKSETAAITALAFIHTLIASE